MAYTVSLATLTRRVLQRVNMENAAVNQFLKSGELTDLINGAIAEWIDEVRGTTWNGTYNRSSQTIPTVAGTQLYALDPTFLSLISVDVFISGGSVISAQPYQEEQRNAFRNAPTAYGWGMAAPVYYQIQGTSISFIPIPQSVYSVTVNYVPTAPTLTQQVDTIDCINGWEEFIVLNVAIKCATKAGQMATVPVLDGMLEKQRARIRSLAPRRDQMSAERVHVIQNAVGDGWDW